MRYLISATLLIVAVIHLLPLVGVFGASRLESLYGIDASEPNLSVLMRHRAVLFGLLGAYLVLAAFKPTHRPIAFAAGYVSVLTFLALAHDIGDYNDQLARVVTADYVALAALVVGTAAQFIHRRRDAYGSG